MKVAGGKYKIDNRTGSLEGNNVIRTDLCVRCSRSYRCVNTSHSSLTTPVTKTTHFHALSSLPPFSFNYQSSLDSARTG